MPDSVPTPKEEISMLKSLPFDELVNKLVTGIITLAINLTIAILVFYAGKFVIRKIYNVTRRILITRNIDQGLCTFLLSMVRIVLYFILIVTVIGILGIETSSFLAIFASAGVAIGMALSGTLQNFAGGVLILLLKPYRIGDYIETQGYGGTVREIQLFSTVITTFDNKSIILPNGGLSTGTINNWSKEAYRRVDWTVGISYGDDVSKARTAILALLNADDRVMQTPPEIDTADLARNQDDSAPHAADAEPEASDAPAESEKTPRRGLLSFLHRHRSKVEQRAEQFKIERAAALARALRPPYVSPTVVVNELGDSAVVLKARAWTKTSDYWSLFYDINEKIYNRLPEAGISFPFPQLDVHYKPEQTHRPS